LQLSIINIANAERIEKDELNSESKPEAISDKKGYPTRTAFISQKSG
jgi:hypothetical protein